MKLPVNAYDLFAYLSSGFMVVVGVDFLDGQSDWLLGKKLEGPDVVFWIFVAYVVGQVVSSPSKMVVEGLTRVVLGPPSIVLFNTDKRRLNRIVEYFGPSLLRRRSVFGFAPRKKASRSPVNRCFNWRGRW